jgi:hypothetical protein
MNIAVTYGVLGRLHFVPPRQAALHYPLRFMGLIGGQFTRLTRARFDLDQEESG